MLARAVALWLLTLSWGLTASAQDARFFRIAGPVTTVITEVSADGWVTWTNQATNATFTIQTTTVLPEEWRDWVQVPSSNSVTLHRTFDPDPPAGMSLVPAGSFTMGDTFNEGSSSSRERPTHTVYVSAFYMDKTEVSRELWLEVTTWASANGMGYGFDNPGAFKAASHPVQTVNWYDMVKWCNARSEKEGLTPRYYTTGAQTTIYKTGGIALTTGCVKWTANGYRLPTEAEWEKAARGGLGGKRFPWGDTISQSQANYYGYTGSYAYDLGPNGYNPIGSIGGTLPATSPVGSFPANGYGLRDMAGNVWEWCWDWYDANWYVKSEAIQDNPRGPAGSGTSRLLRGGNSNNGAAYARCAVRSYGTPSSADYDGGFRCVRGL